MKKLALAVAVAAISGQAAAAQVYSNDNATVDVYGQIRTRLQKTHNNDEKSFDVASSRIGAIGNYKINDDLTATGKIQIKYSDGDTNFYSDALYVGLNSKSLGEVRVGTLGSIWDDEMGLHDYTYAFGGASTIESAQYGTAVQSNMIDYRLPITTSVGTVTLRAQTQLAPSSSSTRRNDFTVAGFDGSKDTAKTTIDKSVSAGVVFNSDFGLDVAAVYAATDVDLQATSEVKSTQIGTTANGVAVNSVAQAAVGKQALGTAKSYGVTAGYTVGQLFVGGQVTRVNVKKDDKSFDQEQTGYGVGVKYFNVGFNLSPYATYDIVKTNDKVGKEESRDRTLAAGIEFKPNAAVRTFAEVSRNINDGEANTTKWAIGARYYF